MASNQLEEDRVAARLIQQLSLTPYACSSLTQQSTRPGNYVYRGNLLKRLDKKLGFSSHSVIIKHTSETVDERRWAFEEALLQSLAKLAQETHSDVAAPILYYSDKKTSIQVFDDFKDSTQFFMSILAASKTTNGEPQSDLATVGASMGKWLRAFHDWTAWSDQSHLRSSFWDQDPVQKLKFDFSFGTVLRVLEQYPGILGDHEEQLRAVQDSYQPAHSNSLHAQSSNHGIIHGDMWSGNILLTNDTQSKSSQKICIIDWELAQFGHYSYDLGQLVGDLYERKVYGNNTSALPVMEAIIRGYGDKNDDMAFRTAIYVGVHLISWHIRCSEKRRKAMTPVVIMSGLTLGRDFILKGWGQDKNFFLNSELASLFEKPS